MNKQEKAKAGLKACSIGLYCPDEECPYAEDKEEKEENCIAALARDALELMKAQEPHVMTAEELEDALDTVVWIERADMKENSSDQYALLDSYSRKYGYFYLQHIQNEHATPYNYRSINRSIKNGWRPWTIRPTDEQREAVPWEA